MASDHQDTMIGDMVRKFVERELLPLEAGVLHRAAHGIEPPLDPADAARLAGLARSLGLWGLDAPEACGGMNLSKATMAAVYEELGRTCVPFRFLPDSPNLHMLLAAGSDAQKRRYLPGYIDGTLQSAIAISEPAAGGDPAALLTRAVADGNGWVINGRKVWISNAAAADFIILMARVGDAEREGGITAFIIDRGTPGLVIERAIPMLGGHTTYELVLDDCRVPGDAVLGGIGAGYAPMQHRLLIRRLEMSAQCAGMTQRALDVLIAHANQRTTFGVRLADRQAIQWWAADAAMRLYACRLMIRDVAEKVDRGQDVRFEASALKVLATELAYETLDHAMQTLGATGMTRETALYPMWQLARLMRIYEGPSEVHRHAIARRLFRDRG